MSEEFATPSFPCVPSFVITLPTIIPSLNLSKPYAAIQVTMSIGCPFDDELVNISISTTIVTPSIDPSISISGGGIS